MAEGPPLNQSRGTPGFLSKIFQLALYIPIQVAFIPIASGGLVPASFKECSNRKILGGSVTASKARQY